MKIRLRSLIKELLPIDACIELYKMTRDLSVDNNIKREDILEILDRYGCKYEPIGSGTNRYTVIMKGFIFKFALDKDGMIDNLREFKYSKALQPYVIKCYEVLPDGLIMVCEYVEVMTFDNFYEDDVRDRMKQILQLISENYFIGDIGIDNKNYTNWGFRKDIYRDPVILDFAYCYTLSLQAFRCNSCKDRSVLIYNDKYTKLICPSCQTQYTFSDIRRTRMSEDDQNREIGDITKQGYIMHTPLEEHEFDPRFSDLPETEEEKPKKKKHQDPYEYIEEYNHELEESVFDMDEDSETEDQSNDVDEDEMFEDLKYDI